MNNFIRFFSRCSEEKKRFFHLPINRLLQQNESLDMGSSKEIIICIVSEFLLFERWK